MIRIYIIHLQSYLLYVRRASGHCAVSIVSFPSPAIFFPGPFFFWLSIAAGRDLEGHRDLTAIYAGTVGGYFSSSLFLLLVPFTASD